jgi:hypothetical protein
MHGVIDKLGDLSWLGPYYSDMGWFETDIPLPRDPVKTSVEDQALNRAKSLLKESDWTMLLDSPLTNSQRAEWKAYRAKLRNIRTQKGFPEETIWPIPPN